MSALVAGVVGAAVLLAVARLRWVVITVRGNSMAPTLVNGQRVLAVRRRAVVRDDVVVFHLAGTRKARSEMEGLPLRVKRVAAVEGDALPQWALECDWAKGLILVPRGKVLVTGDNPVSQDSRQLGLVDVAAIVAKVNVTRSP